ncbi:MAG: hypothetical protein ABIN48_06375, partial [Ginsengibacter sp.]
KIMGTEITQKRIDLYNDHYESKILCQIEDKKDENGKPAGTCVRLTLKEESNLILTPLSIK